MRFWDASALVPLLLREDTTPMIRGLVNEDPDVVVWWGTWTECLSAVSRAARMGLGAAQQERARSNLGLLSADWSEIVPSPQVRSLSEQALFAHDLRAADALQFAAALDWCNGKPAEWELVCRDRRLRDAAASEGFTLLP